MATPSSRGSGPPRLGHEAQNQIPDGPLTLDEARRVGELHLRDLANRRAQEDQVDDFDTTDEYDDDGGDPEGILSDEDDDEEVGHWGERRQRGPGAQQADLEGDIDVDIHDEEVAPTEDYEYEEMEDTTPIFDPAALGLKEINNLAHFSVSSHKPGNGVVELLNDDLDKYWQSDGQQPHLLTMHFLRRVEIRAMRFFVDHTQDESYTPIHILWFAGTGHHDLMQFGEQVLSSPCGWQEVTIEGLGGGHDGNSLCCYIVQMHVKENHQNGKDTHIRGIKIYAVDENAPRSRAGAGVDVDEMDEGTGELPNVPASSARGAGPDDDLLDQLLGEDPAENLDEGPGRPNEPANPARPRFDLDGMSLPDFMREPEIR